VTLLAIDAGQLAEVIWVSLLAGVGVTAAYSFVVLGTAGFAQARRAGRGTAALGYGLLAAVALLVFAAGVIYGVHVLLAKQ
jgi:hypothetical protein